MSKNLPDIFGAQTQEVGDGTAERNASQLMAAQARLKARLEVYERRQPDAARTASLDRQLKRMVDADRTGLAKNLATTQQDSQLQSIANSQDTGWLIEGSESLKSQQLEQRMRTVEKMRGAVDAQIRDMPIARTEIRLDRLEGRQGPSVTEATQPVGTKPRAIQEKHSIGDKALDTQARKLIADQRGQQLLAQYRQVVARVTAEASSAREVANVLLSKPGQTGVSNSEQNIANLTLVKVNNLGIISPSTLTTARVTSNGSFLNQAVLTRALKLQYQDQNGLKTDTAKTVKAEAEQERREVTYEAAVVAMDEHAKAIAENANSKVMERPVGPAIDTTGLELSRSQLPTPVTPS